MWLLEQQNFSYFLHFFVIAYCLVKFCPNLNESEKETMVLSYQRIGQRIHVIRKARKLTQAELAERANLSVPYISHIENGIKQASLQAVVNIAEALGCTVDKLLYEDHLNRRNLWQPELAELLSDCTAAEQQFLLEILIAVKHCVKAQADS